MLQELINHELLYELSSWHLLTQSQQWKHQSNVWNPYKVNNKDSRRRHSQRSGVYIANFEQILLMVLVFPVLTLNK